MIAEFLEIKKEGIDKVPDRLEISLSGTNYIIEIIWNFVDKAFGVNVFTSADEQIISGKRLVIGVGIFDNCESNLAPDDVDLIPLPLTETAQKTGINYENFQEDIKIYKVYIEEG